MEKNERTTVFICNQYSSSAVVAVGYYGEVGYSNTPALQFFSSSVLLLFSSPVLKADSHL